MPQPAAHFPHADLSDFDLARRASERDEAAFRTIMQRYNARLYRIARGISGSDNEAEDVVQESYLRAFIHFATFRGESSLGTWLTRIVINEAMGRRRRPQARADQTTPKRDPLEATILRFPSAVTEDTPERQMAQREIRQLVENAIDRLPNDYRLILITRVIEDMSVDETAKLLDISVETVKTRLHRARALLRKQLDEQTMPVLLDAFPFLGNRCTRLTEAVMGRLDGRLKSG